MENKMSVVQRRGMEGRGGVLEQIRAVQSLVGGKRKG